jgi:hypothetical protein
MEGTNGGRRGGVHAVPRGQAHTTIVSEHLYRPETARRVVEGSRGQGVYPPKDALLHRFAERYVAVRDGSV